MSFPSGIVPAKLDHETAASLYRAMVKIRRAEEKVAEIYPSDKIQSPVHLCIGQEAVSAGVCLALGSSDRIYGTYRGHGLYVARGGEMTKLFAELYAKDTGCARGKGGSMHVVAREVGLMGCSAIVASTIPIATGDALASQLQGRKRVVVSFFGDGAVDEGVFFESMNFAALKKLPVIFVCENNNYAVHSKVADRHAKTELYRLGEALGVPGKQFDGNDAAVVYTTMREAVRNVREGGGPLLIEYMTYRWYEHVGPGKDHKESYRDKAKLESAIKNDPVAKLREVLAHTFRVPEANLAEWEKSIDREIQDAVRFAEESPFPPPNRLHEDLFSEKK